MIKENIQQLQQEIQETAAKVGRNPGDIQILLVTKYVEGQRIQEAYDQGFHVFGENRVQEFKDKKAELPSDIQWHLIGHLQTNKVKYVVGSVALIQSLDRMDLFQALEKEAQKRSVEEVPCLIQVNSSKEATKSGFKIEEVPDFVSQIASSSPIKIKGLMTMGPLTEDASWTRQCFQETKVLFEKLEKDFPKHDWNILSMGMSSDFKIAIEEGSNLIRIGSKVFGKRVTGIR